MGAARNNRSSLHQALVDHLIKRGIITSPLVEAAFRAVPRHLFLPNLAPEEVYRDQAIPTKVVDGQFLSSSSQPAMMAIMLEQLQILPGMRVLEIGAGTGYNAALMSQIVGETGQVVTIDIDEDLVENARAHLNAAGFERVLVLCADGAQGYADAAPYDRVVLTVSASDIAPAWREQLGSGGRLLLPLSLHGMQVSVAFEPREDHLESVSVMACGFVGLRGELAEPDTLVRLRDDPGRGTMFVRPATPHPLDPRKLYRALRGPSWDMVSGLEVTVQQIFSSLGLWLALRHPLFGEIVAHGSFSQQGLVPRLFQHTKHTRTSSTLGLFSEDTLSVLLHPLEMSEEAFEAPIPFPLATRTFGPDRVLASSLHDLIQSWHISGRPDDQRLRISAYPDDIDIKLEERDIIVAKKWMRFVCYWN